MRRVTVWLLAALASAWGCQDATRTTGSGAGVPATGTAVEPTQPAPTPQGGAPQPIVSASAVIEPAPPRRDHLTLIAGGDVFFGRMVGQVLLAKPETEIFAQVQFLLDSADVRFANLECQLSDQKGVTVHPENHLVFTGPPAGADLLKRARFDIVSTANNHMWDFGKDALFQTFDNLERVGVQYVGSGRDTERAYAPVYVEREGFKLAFLAVTDIWNFGELSQHPAREFVARADAKKIAESVKPVADDPTVDAVIVSYHGGSEYMEEPTLITRAITHAAIDAGADVVIGHHPHVAQGVSFYQGRPILYSLGNFTMGMKGEHPWSRYGYLARIRFERDKAPAIEACPFLIHYFTPIPLSLPEHDATEAYFFRKLGVASGRVAGATIGAPGVDGCAPIGPPEKPVPGAIP
jgi:poly-gamma-glutamate capsule biosynthesis protein CapA/YwtB (metallophosphatase superfamily)